MASDRIRLVNDDIELAESIDPAHARKVLLVLSLKRLSALSLQAIELSATFSLAHLVFLGIATLVPEFDPSHDFVSASFHRAWQLGISYGAVRSLVLFAALFVPFVFRYEECARAQSMGPANQLRRSWTPTFWTPAAQDGCAQLSVACSCALISGLFALDTKSKYVSHDPFHAAVIGLVGRGLWMVIRTRRLVSQIEREDDGDGVWAAEVR